jgi:predicted AlkP superfamily phosphohydrolase/phosphomutase
MSVNREEQIISRRSFLKKSALATAAITTGLKINSSNAGMHRLSRGKKVIVIGIDGMDPRLSEKMMAEGILPNFAQLRNLQGYKRLGTSIPPQSPVAWANFINGAGPGSHGIFDFIHRNPQNQVEPFFAAAETVSGQGYMGIGDHKIPLVWPFHKSSETLLRRQGTPFWDYLDKAKIYSTFYNLPSNYPPSPSEYGYHKCLSGMGTPDLLGTYGTYQHFAEDGPVRTKDDGGGKRSMVFFENNTSKPALKLIGPPDSFLKDPRPATIEFLVHRDLPSRSAVIEIQKHKILLKEGQWSNWLKVDFLMPLPSIIPDQSINGICRFYLQQVEPNFKLYVTPINTDPSEPAIKITEPPKFIEAISKKLGLFYTTGFQEDHKALSNGVFTEDEFVRQATTVLEERLNLLDYALKNYDDGLLFFYFSSTDLQSHMLWWDSELKHPTRTASMAKHYFDHIKNLYQKMDSVLGDILKRYNDSATVIVLSDHGFANFKGQFNLNSWLRDNGYLGPADCTSIMSDVDWSKTKAYGLGINGLYVNLKGRERDGVVEPGTQKEALLEELKTKLESVKDSDGRQVIACVHRTDKAYSGNATALAPDLIVGYRRNFRASWATCLGDLTSQILLDNDSAWSADHCADVSEVPGVVFCNKSIKAENPRLIDLGPSILAEFGLSTPSSMEGQNILAT